jgi:hypothetical protein
MKRSTAILSIAFTTLSLAVPATAAVHSHEPAGHHSAGHHPATSRLAFDAGRKWATDEPLRQHMGEIRNALAGQSRAILEGSLSDADAKALGAQIELRVAAIVAECKLPPAADENLHLVVADLVQAAEILQGRTRQKAQRGTALATRATQMYATYFDHPGWRPVHEGSLTFGNASLQ